MGLRINTNTAALSALRNLTQADINQSKSLERLSTGLRINRASDDPSGMVISTQLRAQITSMDQALTNCENASNMVGTAEASLAEVHDLLIKIRESCIYALNSGATDADQISAEQDAVDSAISAIDRIAKSTRFAKKGLLNGVGSIRTAVVSNEIQDLFVQQVELNGQLSNTFSLNVVASASMANLSYSNFTVSAAVAGASGYARMRVTGALGSEIVTFAHGTTAVSAAAAINIVTGNTGVIASAAGAVLNLRSFDYGSKLSTRFEFVDGNALTYSNNGAGGVLSAEFDVGTDTIGFVNGVKATTSGLYMSVTSPVLKANWKMASAGGGGPFTFTAIKSGLAFQMNSEARPADMITIGIQSVEAGFLGETLRDVTINGTQHLVGGFLDTLKDGADNSLANDPVNAVWIVDKAIGDISDVRSYLGSLQADIIDVNSRSLGVAIENLTASESDIRDLNFAAETSEFTRSQILFQSGVAVLASANMVPQSILNLLTA